MKTLKDLWDLFVGFLQTLLGDFLEKVILSKNKPQEQDNEFKMIRCIMTKVDAIVMSDKLFVKIANVLVYRKGVYVNLIFKGKGALKWHHDFHEDPTNGCFLEKAFIGDSDNYMVDVDPSDPSLVPAIQFVLDYLATMHKNEQDYERKQEEQAKNKAILEAEKKREWLNRLTDKPPVPSSALSHAEAAPALPERGLSRMEATPEEGAVQVNR